MIVTIDGPAGAGKSSVARLLARRLGFQFLDTGATFRAVALSLSRHNVNPYNEADLKAHLPTIRIELSQDQVLLNDRDVTDEIRTQAMGALASEVATLRPVRSMLAELQQALARGQNVVCEGRDQGTVVFPQAECKFFLIASDEERARRRQKQLAAKGEHLDFETLLRQQRERDHQDSNREVAPLRAADDAHHLDSTAMSVEAVVDYLEEKVRQRLAD